jgi:hypothetical protein
MDAPDPSTATEIGMGEMEIVSTRMDRFPVRQMFAPPSTMEEKL